MAHTGCPGPSPPLSCPSPSPKLDQQMPQAFCMDHSCQPLVPLTPPSPVSPPTPPLRAVCPGLAPPTPTPSGSHIQNKFPAVLSLLWASFPAPSCGPAEFPVLVVLWRAGCQSPQEGRRGRARAPGPEIWEKSGGCGVCSLSLSLLRFLLLSFRLKC